MSEYWASFVSDLEQAKAIMAVADLVLKLVIALVGFYLAHSLSRKIALRISEKRLSTYSKIWAITGRASPARLLKYGAGPLSKLERELLHDDLAILYYSDGNGMLLANGTRTMFLKVKDNLIRPLSELKPAAFSAEVLQAEENKRDDIRGSRLIQQLSLLRTRMKADLGVFGIHYGGGLTKSDRAFLLDCGEHLWRRPWRKPLYQRIRESL